MKFKRLLVALGAGIALAAPAADELTRVIGYNVLIGFNRAERIEETANWLRSRKPDVICFRKSPGRAANPSPGRRSCGITPTPPSANRGRIIRSA